jgi:ribonuclease D
MEIPLIHEAPTLAQFCARLRGVAWIALDTEFTRERTYHARLGLVQVATDDAIACVDPLAVDLAPLLEVLYDPATLKVLHAGRQDLEVFHDLRGAVPAPVFDTQVAAALLGYPDQIGYAALVEKVTGVKLAKMHTRANWEVRPLPPGQIAYALDDVRYLRDVYRALASELERRGRRAWLDAECAALADPGLYRNDPETAYLRIGAGAALAPAAQTVLKALAAWRERTARSHDRPRTWIAPDGMLVEIARAAPTDLETLRGLPQVTEAAVRRHGQAILAAVREARSLPPERVWPAPLAPDPAEQQLAQRMLARVKAVARAEDISPTLLATRRAVLNLLRNREGPLACGWRRQLIGEELLRMGTAKSER